MKSIIILLIIILMICLFYNNNINEIYRSITSSPRENSSKNTQERSNQWETVNNKLCSYTGINKLENNELTQYRNLRSFNDCIKECQSMNNKPPGTTICKACMWNKRSKVCNIFKKECYNTKNNNNYIINRLKLTNSSL